MFKSILSSRRIPSSEFDMLTPPAAEQTMNGKENYPALATTTNIPATTKSRNEKTHKKSKTLTKEPMAFNDGDTEMAFDRLLVSTFSVWTNVAISNTRLSGRPSNPTHPAPQASHHGACGQSCYAQILESAGSVQTRISTTHTSRIA